MALDTLAGVRGEMARLYRLALNGRIRSDEMTRFIYALKEILSQAVDQIENRLKRNRAQKLVTILVVAEMRTRMRREIATSRLIPRIGMLPSWFSSGRYDFARPSRLR